MYKRQVLKNAYDKEKMQEVLQNDEKFSRVDRETVSYTHLDVYKRQDEDGKKVNPADKKVQCGDYIISVNDVSYTHLDVYKRQVWRHERFPKGG